jgi:HEAT repeat protein
VRALGVIGGDMAIKALEGALGDEDKAVRMLATEELRRLKGEG